MGEPLENTRKRMNERAHVRCIHDITIRSARRRRRQRQQRRREMNGGAAEADGDGEDGGLNRGWQVSFASIAVSCPRRAAEALFPHQLPVCLCLPRAAIGRRGEGATGAIGAGMADFPLSLIPPFSLPIQ